MGSIIQVPSSDQDEHWMAKALALAYSAGQLREVPVGAVITLNGEMLGTGHNCSILHYDATAHAEVRAIRRACEFTKNYRLSGATLYVTLEPCTMCVGAIIHSRIARVVFATTEPRAGALVSAAAPDFKAFNHSFEYTSGVRKEESARLLRRFFKARR